MKKGFVELILERMTQILEMIIAVIISIGVIIGLVDLVRYFPEIFAHDAEVSYDIFQNFLGHALILIVGVELMLMIINQSTRGILELVLFVIARKMLIYSGSMLDLVMGTIAIAMVFLILKFLVNTNDDEILIRKGRTKGDKKAGLDRIDLDRTDLDR